MLRHESLESRTLLAADWHNAVLPCDVDESGLVTPRDVLLIVSSLNDQGSRQLSPSEQSTHHKFDVSGDSQLTPRDALIIISVINRALPEQTVASGLAPDSDPNGNGVVLIDRVVLRGETGPHSKLKIEIENLEAPQAATQQNVTSDIDGRFSVTLDLSYGLNRLNIQSIDELGRSATIGQEIRRGDTVADWNSAALNVVRDWTTVSNDPYQGRIVPSQPPLVARNLAMIHSAMFDAVNAVVGGYQMYAFQGATNPNASSIAAAAEAAHRVASNLYSDSDELSIWDASLEEALKTVTDADARQQGIILGDQVADSILQLRANDGANETVTYTPGTDPGEWNRTQPDNLPPLLPQWPNVTPFSIASGGAFRPAPPPSLNSSDYAAAVDEVMSLGRLDSTTRTADQTEIALFWADGGGTATPPGHWNRIATDVAIKQNLSLIESARTMALVNIGLADAGIVAWDAKYHFNFWRPIDAIQKADLDGNAATAKDANWQPLLKTPPFPTYTSGHSTFSGAAAAVLTAIFGDNYGFSSTTDSHSGPSERPLASSQIVTSNFTSFEQAAAQAGQSRIYGGIHFQFDNTAGLESGKLVGQYVVAHELEKM